MIVTAFANGDRAGLRPLLSDEVFHAFGGSIAARRSAHEHTAFTFVGFKDAKIVEAALKARIAGSPSLSARSLSPQPSAKPAPSSRATPRRCAT